MTPPPLSPAPSPRPATPVVPKVSEAVAKVQATTENPAKGQGKGPTIDPNTIQILYQRSLAKPDDGPNSRHPYYPRDQTPCPERVFLLPKSVNEVDPNGMTYTEFRRCVKAYILYMLSFVSSYRTPNKEGDEGNWMIPWLEESVSMQAATMWCELSRERSLAGQYSLLNRDFLRGIVASPMCRHASEMCRFEHQGCVACIETTPDGNRHREIGCQLFCNL